jgi:hypothetical protein
MDALTARGSRMGRRPASTCAIKSPSRSFPLQDRDLLPEGEDLKGGVPATAEEHAYYSQD